MNAPTDVTLSSIIKLHPKENLFATVFKEEKALISYNELAMTVFFFFIFCCFSIHIYLHWYFIYRLRFLLYKILLLSSFQMLRLDFINIWKGTFYLSLKGTVSINGVPLSLSSPFRHPSSYKSGFVLAIWRALESWKDGEEGERTLHPWPRSSEICGCSRPF